MDFSVSFFHFFFFIMTVCYSRRTVVAFVYFVNVWCRIYVVIFISPKSIQFDSIWFQYRCRCDLIFFGYDLAWEGFLFLQFSFGLWLESELEFHARLNNINNSNPFRRSPLPWAWKRLQVFYFYLLFSLVFFTWSKWCGLIIILKKKKEKKITIAILHMPFPIFSTNKFRMQIYRLIITYTIGPIAERLR